MPVITHIEDLSPIFVAPLSTFVSLAVLIHSGRPDLAGYALAAALLLTTGSMALFIGS